MHVSNLEKQHENIHTFKAFKKEKTMDKTPGSSIPQKAKNRLWQGFKQLKSLMWIALFVGPNCIYAAGSTKKYVNNRANMDLNPSKIRDSALEFLQSFWFGANVPYLIMVIVGMLVYVAYLMWDDFGKNKKKVIWVITIAVSLSSIWPIAYFISGISPGGG